MKMQGTGDDEARAIEPSFRRAWKEYIPRVPPNSIRQIRNFMLAVVAEGRNPTRDDTAVDGASRGKPVLCKLDLDKVNALSQASVATDAEKFDHTNFAKVMHRTRDTAMKLSEESKQNSQNSGDMVYPAWRHCLEKPDIVPDALRESNVRDTKAAVETYRQAWKDAYETWEQTVFSIAKRPNAKQWQVLKLIHERCIYEYQEEVTQTINATLEENHQEPLFRMVHGLPGAGKSEILKWVQTYFENVWLWTRGIQFEYLAPLNMMAHGIGGQTIHSFGYVSSTGTLSWCH
jgi:hypothetical protein